MVLVDVKSTLKAGLSHIPGALPLARLTAETVRVCLRYRVTGLASEAGFFALLSLPPLILGLFGGVGYVGKWVGQEAVNDVTQQVVDYAGRFLTPGIIQDLLLPTVNDVLQQGRFDLISVGFVLSVWSGSRALNVLVDTISIMYGQSGRRGIVRTRILSLSLYFVGLVVGIIVIPLVLAGPSIVAQILPERLSMLANLYWPVVSILVVVSLTGLFHIATPKRSPFHRDMPGAVLTLVAWAIASYAVRGVISASLGGTSIYGPLSAPIVLLIWLYFIAIAVLIGAALNAAIRNLWPHPDLAERRISRVVSAAVETATGPIPLLGRRSSDDDEEGGQQVAASEAAGSAPGQNRDGSGAVAASETASAGGESEASADGHHGKRPLTPFPEDKDSEGRSRRFGDDEDDRIMSLRTRSGQ